MCLNIIFIPLMLSILVRIIAKQISITDKQNHYFLKYWLNRNVTLGNKHGAKVEFTRLGSEETWVQDADPHTNILLFSFTVFDTLRSAQPENLCSDI
jgi:hypothetical protein